MDVVLAIDPGSEKCGIAVVSRNNGVLFKKVTVAAGLLSAAGELAATYKIKAMVIGNGTGSKAMRESLAKEFSAKEIQLLCVDEYRTTDLAKIKYWQENPPKGWRRLLPTSLQVPPVPVDDYVAVILAERYLRKY